MPLSRSIARANRKITNPITRRFAGRLAPFAILIHTGRTSGKTFRTPIMAFPVESGFAIALTYGRGTDWEKNVRRVGHCELIYRGKTWTLTNPRTVNRESVRTAFPAIVRLILAANHVDDVLLLDRAGS
ncbi:MAG: nitroreductase family deazaflavin-dependent oxidoreductase [Thermomicrobiales bacterium]